MKVLVVEDDLRIADYVCDGLRQQGHVVDHAGNGRDALFLALEPGHDVLVVDRMLPGMDGLAVVRALRASGSGVPILLLTALGGIDDRVEGLNAGADDYLVKPFAFSELSARLAALARRPAISAQQAETTLKVGSLELDLLRRTVVRDGRSIELQPREFRLLEVLMRHAGAVVTRTMLLEQVWEFHFDPRTNIVETHISRLRGKIDREFDSPMLHTVRGAGYSLRG